MPPRRLRVNTVARTLLAGALLPGPSPLRVLSAAPDVLEHIFKALQHIWRDDIRVGLPMGASSHAFESGRSFLWNAMRQPNSSVFFPAPANRCCNMMPIHVDDHSSVPAPFDAYIPLIAECRRICPDCSPVWYLTVHESRASSRSPQRRGGIHTEGFLSPNTAEISRPFNWVHWGFSSLNPIWGGVLHASTVSNSCRMWNVEVNRAPSGVLRAGCDLEHLRGTLNDLTTPVEPKAGELYLMTDATPHESLPLSPGTYRQYFRLVFGKLDVWYAQHNTPNPRVQPECRIRTNNKFESGYA